MGLADFEIYIQERLRAWDQNIDLTSGSPVNAQVIQPILQRLGTDPFTVDAAAFIYDRISQEHPEIAIGVGDATTDLLVKQALLLWDPIIREVQRVKAMQSFKDPYLLNTTEAEALGANLFSEINKGKYAKGVGRIYFAQAMNISISQSNFVTSSSGLRFYPTQIQSIRKEEMLLNKEGELYYFDVNFVAEAPGESYNIEPTDLTTIANVAAAVKVTNKARFRDGLDADDSVSYIGRIARSLTERSLVTLRGIIAKIAADLPEITRIQVVGFNDPEMKRDVIKGGGFGRIRAYGSAAIPVVDGHGLPTTRRVRLTGYLETTLPEVIGPIGAVSGWYVTLIGIFGPGVVGEGIQDCEIARVINDDTVEISESILALNYPGTGTPWMLRKKELTLSGIPGGILFPDGVNGTVDIVDDEIHIGGCTDTHTRGATFESASLTVDEVTDDSPLLYGELASGYNPPAGYNLVLNDLELDTPGYVTGDATYQALDQAGLYQYVLQILGGNNEGIYRILKVYQQSGHAPALLVEPAPPSTASTDASNWKLLDTIDIDLVEPKDTRVRTSDGKVYQHGVRLTTNSGIDFGKLGVSAGDVLRILTGNNKGDYNVLQVMLPSYVTIEVDREFQFTETGISFIIFRKNVEGGVTRPLIRVDTIDLLDTTGQPVGVTIPYAKPIEVRAYAFSNTGGSSKTEQGYALLGLVTTQYDEFDCTGLLPGQNTFNIWWESLSGSTYHFDVVLPGSVLTAADMVDLINTASSTAGLGNVAYLITTDVSHVGIQPIGVDTRLMGSIPAVQRLWPEVTTRFPTARDIRAMDNAHQPVDWTTLSSKLEDDTDVVYVIDGLQSGYYPYVTTYEDDNYVITVNGQFEPEAGRMIRIGRRSFGRVRAYFLNPTSFEVDQDSRFSITKSGMTLGYIPDPGLNFQMFPALPNGDPARDGAVLSSSVFESASQQFIKRGVRAGDLLEVTFTQLVGTSRMEEQVPVAGLDIRISVDEEPDKIITFLNDTGVAGQVSRDGVYEQINAWIGQSICSMVDVGAGEYRLVFDDTVRIALTGGAALAVLGFTAGKTNEAKNKGTYTIGSVDSDTAVTITGSTFPDTETAVQYKVFRPASQRISTTQMEDNIAGNDLYYMDIELVSVGMGEEWNLSDGDDLEASNYRSDGYWLTTDDENTSFSTTESIHLHLSRSIIESGADDDPTSATQLSGQQISINYSYSSSVLANQNLQSSDSERVICQSPLARHLTPHFVRMDVGYQGGSKETIIQPLVETYINNVDPSDAIESSDVQQILLNKGATYISNPIDLVAIVYDVDRSIYAHRSQDKLTTGRLAAFIPDVIKLTRQTS